MSGRLRFLRPRTLGTQLIVVVATAVFISNAAVAVWFELSRERLTEHALTERLLDRAVSSAALLAAIPARSRDAVARTMSSGPWQFVLHKGKLLKGAMNEREAQLAARARAMLPQVKRKDTVLVGIFQPPPGPRVPGERGPIEEITRITLPVVRGTQMQMSFARPALPSLPPELVAAAIVAIFSGSLAAAFIARRVAQPLSQLAAAATEAARGGDAPRVPEHGPEDVRVAAAAFNRMTDQVARTLASQRQLLSAVGHDLRTPITALRINSEFVADQDLRERLQKNLEELQELTESVLSSARGIGGEKTRRIDVAALVESVCADLDEMGRPVSWHARASAPISGRPNEIKRAVRNLIENAIAYGNHARVAIEDADGGFTIIVDDEGPGIPEEDLERVFGTFVRLEESRNSETGGSGLGLSLVKTIAEGHGGCVKLANRREGGLRAQLYLPLELPPDVRKA